MRFNKIIVGSAALAASVFASPTPSSLDNRSEKCDAFDSIAAGSYTIFQNLFGASSATSGEQCSSLGSIVVDTLSWSTSWTWEGDPSTAKSFANAALDLATSQQISQITSVPTSWDWSSTGTNVVANVAYDISTSSTANGGTDFEIFIWLGTFGGAVPIGTGIDFPLIDGSSWELFQGTSGGTTVYTFVADNNLGSFVADLTDFFGYLVTNQGFSDQQFVTGIGAGMQTFTGSDAEFDVQSYTVSIF